MYTNCRNYIDTYLTNTNTVEWFVTFLLFHSFIAVALLFSVLCGFVISNDNEDTHTK